MSMLSARLAASVARSIPRSAQQVSESNYFDIFLINRASGRTRELHNNFCHFFDENSEKFRLAVTEKCSKESLLSN